VLGRSEGKCVWRRDSSVVCFGGEWFFLDLFFEVTGFLLLLSSWIFRQSVLLL
jgi:hypothetical protein